MTARSELVPASGMPVRENGGSMVDMVEGDKGWQISADLLQVVPPKS